MPIPLAALSLVGYTLLSIEVPFLKEAWPLSALYIVFFAVLMITNVPFWSFKDADWVKKHKKRVFALVLLLICLIAIYEEVMIVITVLLYTIISLIYYALNRKKMGQIFAWKGEEDEA